MAHSGLDVRRFESASGVHATGCSRCIIQNSMISLKKTWVSSDGWRGRHVPINAVAGVSDTGNWDDSPCPSNVGTEELNRAKVALKKAGIRYKTTWGTTSNIFCIHRYVVVAEDDVEIAKDIIQPLIEGTTLLYVC